MDFIEASLRSSANMGHAAAREIALALGVPPMLLGIPGDNTFSNYQEANRTFWRNTVVPLISRAADSLSDWLSPAFGDTPLKLSPDLDEIEALAPEREALWSRLEKATFLTQAEKRQAAGYGAPDSGAKTKRPRTEVKWPGQPRSDHGQFDFGQQDEHPTPAGVPARVARELLSKIPRGQKPTPPPAIPPKLAPPSPQPGTVTNDLGQVWGRKPSDTTTMKQALDLAKVEELQAGGFTKDLAKSWERFYENELVRNPGNEAASARVGFIKRFLELSK